MAPPCRERGYGQGRRNEKAPGEIWEPEIAGGGGMDAAGRMQRRPSPAPEAEIDWRAWCHGFRGSLFSPLPASSTGEVHRTGKRRKIFQTLACESVDAGPEILYTVGKQASSGASGREPQRFSGRFRGVRRRGMDFSPLVPGRRAVNAGTGSGEAGPTERREKGGGHADASSP